MSLSRHTTLILTLLLASLCSELSGTEPGCLPGSRTGQAGDTIGPLYNVHTPRSYNPVTRYPLIVVYPGYGESKDADEILTNLAGVATEHGYVIAFTGHYSPVKDMQVVAASRVPSTIADRWCIDREQVFLVGNSDGATTLSVVVIDKLLDPPPAAVVVNAVGWPRSWLQDQPCPPPLGYMSMHGTKDMVWKIKDGFGVTAADWWASCNKCKSPLGEDPGLTCHGYESCPAEAGAIYCQYDGHHAVWKSDFNARILAFFERYRH